jgi:hypothetical protein
MASDEIGLRSDFFTFDHALAEMRRDMGWVEHLARHRSTLDSIADIVRLDTLWADAESKQRLRLRYAGTAKSQAEAREDLRRIRSALKCRLLELKAYAPYDRSPTFHYEGMGRIGRRKVLVELRVPWFKPGCRVESQEIGRSRPLEVRRRYSLACDR